MAQGKLKAKSKAPPRRKAGRTLIAATRTRKNIPAKQKKNKRDPKMTKLLHKNIERLIAAKAIRNEGSLRLKGLANIGKKQLEVENNVVEKKRKRKTKEEILEHLSKKAQKKSNVK